MATMHTASGTIEKYSYTPFGARRDAKAWYQKVKDVPARFSRGYCMQEHLPEFELIDLNGRMYDPYTRQFLSPDPYIKDPTSWSNYNRYAYCLQNPMLYTDPNGEYVHILIGAVIGGAVNWVTHGCKFNVDGLKAFGVGALAGAVAAVTMGAATGALATTVMGETLAASFVSGFVSSLASTPFLVLGNSIAFGDPMMTFGQLVFSSLVCGASCMALQGLSNFIQGRNIWNGKFPTAGNPAQNTAPIEETITEPLSTKSLQAGEECVESNIGELPSAETVNGNTIKEFHYSNLKTKFENHIYSSKHLKDGIEKALGGISKEDGFNKIYETILDLNKKNLIVEGRNQFIVTTKSGFQVGIRAFIQQGELTSMDAFVIWPDANIEGYAKTINLGNINW